MKAAKGARRVGGAWLFCLAVQTLVSAATAGAAPNLRYAKSIASPALEKEELVSVALDGDVYAATQDGLPDVRVLDASDGETAFILRPATETKSTKIRKTWSARKPKIKLLDGDGLEITVELNEKDPSPRGMRLVTPLTNFEQQVQVFSSPDGQDWTPILEEGLIFDYSQFMDVRNDALEFPVAPAGAATGWRHFRIVIDDVTKEQQSQLMELTRRLRGEDETDRSERVTIVRQPFRIDRIEFWSDVDEQRVTGNRTVDYAVKSGAAEQDAEHKQTIIPVMSRREPLTLLRLVTADRNFSRSLRVEVERQRGNASTWEPMGSANVSRLDFRDVKRENLDVSIPETRDQNLRLVIDNRDSPPLNVTGVEARGTAYEAVFLADPAAKYRLAYGNAAMEAPSYDTAAVAALLAADYQPLSAQLGEQAVLSAAAPEDGESLLKRLLNSPTLLTAAIALLAIVLAIGLYRASRRVDDLPR